MTTEQPHGRGTPSTSPPAPATRPEAAPADKAAPAHQAAPSDKAAAPSDEQAAPGAEPAVPRQRARERKALPTERPAGAPPDPWTAFASTGERPPGRFRRSLRNGRRQILHEYAVAAYLSMALAVALTWPALRYPLHTLPHGLADPARQAWQVAWSGHILNADPSRLWQSNAYYPEPLSFAFGDALLGYAPAGMIGDGPLAAVLRYNLLFVLAHALLTFGGYMLIRQLGAGRTGALVAAVAFAYAPWRLAQEGHLDLISAGGIPLALAMLARGHGWSLRHGWRADRRRPGWAIGGWCVAAWQISLGFALGLPFAYALGVLALILLVAVPVKRLRHRGTPVLGWRLLATDTLGALVTAGIGALIAVPYLRAHGGGSAVAEIAASSPPVQGLLIGPAGSQVWGGAHAGARASLTLPGEMALLPGFVLYALALAGVFFSVWTLRRRLFLLIGLAVAVILTLGTTFFGGRWSYLPLFGRLPAALDQRVPGRLMFWVTLVLAVLAAGAVSEIVRRADQLSSRPWPNPWLRVAMLVPLLLVTAEGWGATATPVVPRQPAAMRTVGGPMLVLPTAADGDQVVQLWTTSRFQSVVNGGGRFHAARQAEVRRAVVSFPDASSVQYLRSLGVGTVLLVRSQVAGTPWERAGDVPVEALGIRREDLDDAVVFRLN